MEGRVLIVDDAAFMRSILKEILREHNFEVVGEAENGEKAILMYKELQPDIVTLDITMPELDGISTAKEILHMDRDAKIIMCSAMGQHAMVVEAIQAGAKDFIVKPFQAEKVVESIRKVLN